MSDNHKTKHIIQSLFVNLFITIFKGFAAFMTKSGSMLAETIHSFADCGNQGLLLMGVKQSQRKPDTKHPMGYGRSVYFWSFMVAMLLFSVGGMFSIYEGIHKINHPEKVENVLWGIAVLTLSLILEGYATYSNILELNKRRKTIGFREFLKKTKDSDLVVIFAENSAAVIGLILALAALTLSYVTGDGRYDGFGSLSIGLILIIVAILLAKELKPLMIGESADEEITRKVEDLCNQNPDIDKVINCVTIQQGPGEVLMCLEIACNPTLTMIELSTLINTFESQLRSEFAEVKWLYIEPKVESAELKTVS